MIAPPHGDESPGSRSSEQPVTLVSAEGAQFCVPLATARYSRALTMMLDARLGWAEARQHTVMLYGVPARTLRRIVEFLEYRRAYDGIADHPPFPIAPEESLELLLAADYLDM